MTRAPLTQVEEQVLHFLLDFLAEHTFQPSVREIAKRLAIPSTKSVADLLASLERKGYIERAAGRSRGVKIVGFGGVGGTIPVPVRELDGAVAALRTVDHLTLDRRLVPADDAYLVRAGPEAAPAHGVRPGDLVLVHPRARAADGDTVVVRRADALLVRTMTHRGAVLVLTAPGTGSDVALGSADDYEVLGVLAAVIRPADWGPVTVRS